MEKEVMPFAIEHMTADALALPAAVAQLCPHHSYQLAALK
jgi:hypothetical protein